MAWPNRDKATTALLVLSGAVLCLTAAAGAQQAGSIRGVVYDKDFDAPLPLAQVMIAETGEKVTATEEGNYVFDQVPPGTYTLVFSKEGYVRQVKAEVVVEAGRMTEVDASLSGEFTEMEELVAEDLQIGGATEAGLLRLRFDSPAFLDSVGADLISRAGASDAAGALRLVSGATVQDDKFAVIRGLPDRYVSSLLNSYRLPSADEETRAVELDQYPAAVIESIQVTKTFTPDQQGDASGGAVNVVTRSIPEETSLLFKAQVGFNTQVAGSSFPTYTGGGVGFWGFDDGNRSVQPVPGLWDGAAGVSFSEAPVDYKWSVSGGGKHEFDTGVKIGGYATFFYERDSAFFDNGIDDSLWVVDPGAPLTPQYFQGAPDPMGGGDYRTKLLDVTQGTQGVQWGGLGTVGIETENHEIGLLYLYTRVTEDTATLAEDTRGKQFFFPGFDPDDPSTPGHDQPSAAPYIRLETLDYTERTTESLQLNGEHTFTLPEFGIDDVLTFLPPEFDWGVAFSSADLNEPDKRQFGSVWFPERIIPLPPPFPTIIQPAFFQGFRPEANVNLGFFQRIFKEINEDSNQYYMNLRFPFEQWTDDEGYFQFGWFDDQVTRNFNQDTFSNAGDNTTFTGDWEEFWSAVFPSELTHTITDGPPFVDVDYLGKQHISAWYGMVDLPLFSSLNMIGGARLESTDLSIVNFPEQDAKWIPPGSPGEVTLNPGDADVSFEREDLLPAIALVYNPIENLTLRLSYAQTIARQTFKELTPVIQQEYLGGPIFIGNPFLGMSSLRNYDLRIDFTPYDSGVLSFSLFHKDITDPIEYVQAAATSFVYTTPVNYPTGTLTGIEIEARQDMGVLWDAMTGLTLGVNATIINSQVTLPQDEADEFNAPNILAPMPTRDMVNAPYYLYNIYLTYDLESTGTQFGLFYTATGDTLVAGAGTDGGNFVPNIYETPNATLNLSIVQEIGEHITLQFQAKNLTNPSFQTVYRSPYIGPDVLNTSSTEGIELSISLSAEFEF